MTRAASSLRNTLVILFLMAAGLAVVLYFSESTRTLADMVMIRIRGLYTIEDRVAMYQEKVADRLSSKFIAAGIPYPPLETTFVAFKDSRRLEIYSRSAPNQSWKLVHTYSILAASGQPGPKLAEGDKQVPEGFYRAESLNPNSRYHLAIRLNYPNEFDRLMATADQRTNLGGDIMIHGNIFSVGCLAMGDDAAEDLFVLAALTKPRNVSVIISPTDFRIPPGEFSVASPAWSGKLYESIKAELRNYRR